MIIVVAGEVIETHRAWFGYSVEVATHMEVLLTAIVDGKPVEISTGITCESEAEAEETVRLLTERMGAGGFFV